MVNAEYADQDIKNPKIIKLHAIKADLATVSGGWSRMKAVRGIFDSQDERLVMQDRNVDRTQGSQDQWPSGRTDRPDGGQRQLDCKTGGARADRSAARTAGAAPPTELMDDVARVGELLGRHPRGAFQVVVRDATGDPVVVRNEPLLEDGTPMPTRYYLVGAELVKAVSRIEASGGVDEVEAELAPDVIAAIHERYEAERDRAIPTNHVGPRPSGGVGGTRVGVKCLHAHVAHELATGDDEIGRWTLHRVPANTLGLTAREDRAMRTEHGVARTSDTTA